MKPATVSAELDEAATAWSREFAVAIETADLQTLQTLLIPDALWRDLLALSWDLHTFSGFEQIASALAALLPVAKCSSVEMAASVRPRSVVRAGRETLEVVFEFDVADGRGRGVARLVQPIEGGPWKAWTVMTALERLAGSEERGHARANDEATHARDFAGPNWRDQRIAEAQFDDREPAVLVVGCGQAGLAIAARLRQLGVDTLIVDRMHRVGDNWRTRYHSLVLHNEVWANHLPYMPFPDTWPTYIPKDLLADWFESYATFMELNVWTDTEFCGGTYSEPDRRWDVAVRLADGTQRELHPRHVVMATGVSGIPYKPAMSGLEEFSGEVFHSGTFANGTQYAGKRMMVVGTGTSGHDVAQDLASNGAIVTLVQRSSTTVVSVGPDAAGQVYGLYLEGHSTELSDLLNVSTPYPVLRHSYQLLTKALLEHDKELLKGLRDIGFQLDFGDDNTGFQMKYLRRGGGYYLNVGCSQMLIDGTIALLNMSEIAHFESEGVRLSDGSFPLDAVILATGYFGQKELVRHLFNDTIADRVGEIWGFDEEGEMRNMWRRTGQPGLWFTAGSLAQARIYSAFLALQIAACEQGVLPLSVEQSVRGALREADLLDV